MLLLFRLISVSLKQLSCDVTNHFIIKENIFGEEGHDHGLLKKAMTETSWDIIVLISSIPLKSCFAIYREIDR